MISTVLKAKFEVPDGSQDELDISAGPEDLEGKVIDMMTGPEQWQGKLKVVEKSYRLEPRKGWIQVLHVEKVEEAEEGNDNEEAEAGE